MKFVKSALAALILTLTVSGLASASYTGPNRTVTITTWERQYCNYRATVVSPAGSCLLTLYFSPGSCPSPSSVAGFFNNAETACGTSWPGTCGAGLSCNIALLTGSTQSCSSGETGCTQSNSTTTYPPATVSGSTVCSVPGNNGWCTGTGTINLSASEPLAGFSITGIEGEAGILCSGPACTWSFPEGITNLTYWALSSWGDTSTIGSATMKVDSLAPSLTVVIPPADGQNGWHISPVPVTGTSSDTTSGLADLRYCLDGEAWTSGTNLSVPEGLHKIEFQASDLAGNITSESKTISVDSAPPTITISLPAPQGAAGWYTNDLLFSASAEDTISGVQSIAYSLDGGVTWQAGALSLADGRYTVITRVTDFAGNFTTRTDSMDVDTTPPQSVFTRPVEGSTTVIHDSFTMNGQTRDLTSGLAAAQISVDGGTTWIPLAMDSGTWSFYWDTNAVPNGTYLLLVQASDIAGNEEHTARITVIVANKGPEVVVTSSTTYGNNRQETGTVSLSQPPASPIQEPPAVPVATSRAIPPAAAVPTGIAQGVAPTPSPAKLQLTPNPTVIDPVYLWPILGFGGLLAAIGSSSWSDRRPSALHHLENSLTNAASKLEKTKD